MQAIDDAIVAGALPGTDHCLSSAAMWVPFKGRQKKESYWQYKDKFSILHLLKLNNG